MIDFRSTSEARAMPSCPACGRSVALVRASCLYCGAPLAAAAVTQAEPAPSAAPQAALRVLVLVDLAGAEPAALAEAFGVSRYEATLLARRGGLHLVRAGAPGDAEAEAERLKARGAEPWLVPEAEVGAPPQLCLAGETAGQRRAAAAHRAGARDARAGRRAARRAGCDHPRVPDARREAADRHRTARGGLSGAGPPPRRHARPGDRRAQLRARLRRERLGPARDRRLARRGERRRHAGLRLRAGLHRCSGHRSPSRGGRSPPRGRSPPPPAAARARAGRSCSTTSRSSASTRAASRPCTDGARPKARPEPSDVCRARLRLHAGAERRARVTPCGACDASVS